MAVWKMRYLLVGALVCSSTPLWVFATNYTLVDLGAGVAKDINSRGQVVGNAPTGGWYFDGTSRNTLKFETHFIGAPKDQVIYFTAATANAINDHGRIVGSVIFVPLQQDTRTAFFSDAIGAATLIGLGEANGLNKAGWVVGMSPAFVSDGVDVSTPPGFLPRLTALNDDGLAVGSVAPDSVDVAASFRGTSFSKLKLSGLSLPDTGNENDYESAASSVNNAAWIVGNVRLRSSALNPKPEWAFLSKSNKATQLGTLGGRVVSAQDVNNAGAIVGSATLPDGSRHAFIHDNDTLADLNLLVTGAFGWVLTSANALNDGGLIVGEGTKDGVQHAFLLKPASDASPPVVRAQPSNKSAFVGDPVTLAVAVSGTTPITYQWQHAGTNLPGATATSYSVARVSQSDAGTYRMVATNPFGSTTSDEALVEVHVRDNVPPVLSVALYAGITITGQIGKRFLIEAAENVGDSSWESLTTVTLNASPYLWVDPTALRHQGRLYRAVPVP